MPQTKTRARDPYASIARRFKSETRNHEMTVLLDQGLHRHLHFQEPGHSAYWFDLITVPGALIFQGDGESFVFRCLRDMFEFFRSNPDRNTLRISPDYWAEKLTNGRDSVKVYSSDLVERNVKDELAAAREWGHRPRGVVKAVREQILESEEIDYEDEARLLLRDFRFGGAFKAECVCGAKANFADEEFTTAAERGERWLRTHQGIGHYVTGIEKVEPFQFSDTSEWDLKDFDWWYLWACHAIVWGIAQYDAAKTAAAPVVEAVAA